MGKEGQGKSYIIEIFGNEDFFLFMFQIDCVYCFFKINFNNKILFKNFLQWFSVYQISIKFGWILDDYSMSFFGCLVLFFIVFYIYFIYSVI